MQYLLENFDQAFAAFSLALSFTALVTAVVVVVVLRLSGILDERTIDRLGGKEWRKLVRKTVALNIAGLFMFVLNFGMRIRFAEPRPPLQPDYLFTLNSLTVVVAVSVFLFPILYSAAKLAGEAGE